MAGIHIDDVEAAINWWRERAPSADGVAVGAEVAALAEVYALMVRQGAASVGERGLSGAATAAWMAWYAQMPDSPCIAICSTAQGDAVCKGCGRHEDEVQHWTRFTPGEKRAVWRRITAAGTAWRFNRYAERAGPPTGR